MKIGICIMSRKLNRPHVKKLFFRLAFVHEIIIFDEDLILNKNIIEWPLVDALVTFFHLPLPFDKIFEYAKMWNIYSVNNLLMQYSLLDRRIVYKILERGGVTVPEFVILTRFSTNFSDELCVYLKTYYNININFPINSICEYNDYIEVENKRIYKPFVEKPANAEDHNIYIYYKNGAVRKLFRKQNDKSSVLFYDITSIRNDGNYIYERFYESENNVDVKVYALGKDYAYAETRKSPTLDGIVERDIKGKEKRSFVDLREIEHDYARRITQMFQQNVCGFDIIRTPAKSYVIDVNGWSFVKNSDEYYDFCADIIDKACDEGKYFTRYENKRVLSIVRVYRHCDRTPKQKYKVKSKDYAGFLEKEIIIKNKFGEFVDILEKNKHRKFDQLLCFMKDWCSEKGTKLQIKCKDEALEMILKWGGVLTHTGVFQCIELADNFKYGLCTKRVDFLANTKVFTSSEIRVHDTAKKFIKNIKGKLSDVIIDKVLLDDTFHANSVLEKSRLTLAEEFEMFLKEADKNKIIETIKNIKTEGIKITNKKESQNINYRWAQIKERVSCDENVGNSLITEIYDNLKYDLMHNYSVMEDLFGVEMHNFYTTIKYYYRYIIKIEYGISKSERMKISKSISGSLLTKILENLENNKEINIYFTKESRIYTLYNILTLFARNDFYLKEFNYGSMLEFLVYVSDGNKRIQISCNKGVDYNLLLDGPLDCRHRIPFFNDYIFCDLEYDHFKETILNILED